eukprot:jgi/Orpsp1_1/1189714/evm.model.d7180000073896.1
MQIVLSTVEKFIDNKDDHVQNIWLSYITSIFSPWLCLTLLINGENYKQPAMKILILHWFFKSTGNLFSEIANSMVVSNIEKEKNYWPYTAKRWLVGGALASLFWIVGEMIGD